jgi:hypothetical protein
LVGIIVACVFSFGIGIALSFLTLPLWYLGLAAI